MRARQPYCFGGKRIYQAAMLVATFDRYSQLTVPFSREGKEKFIGMTALLCDAGQSLELAGEHTLRRNYDRYPLIIVPELYRDGRIYFEIDRINIHGIVEIVK